MNLRDPNTELLKMPDVQSSEDERHIAIERVGIRALRYPVLWHGEHGQSAGSVATFSMAVGLSADRKGTHMSRFVALLDEHAQKLSLTGLLPLYREMLTRLDATQGELQFSLPMFMRKVAPASGVSSFMDYELSWRLSGSADAARITLNVLVPVTSLCPCSKAISEYGAHNQRSHVRMSVVAAPGNLPPAPEALIRMAESQASSELYGLLKRVDEKVVTERAYDNPKFVEDLARDVAAGLIDWRERGQIESFSLEVENFESIHNHSAFAQIIG